MGVLYVAASKKLGEWGSDVGLGKHLYKVGISDDGAAPDGMAGESDWTVLATAETDKDEAEILERLARKEKLVDPLYYPRLKGLLGVVKVSVIAVENAMLVAFALDNREPPKNFKVKPTDIARHLLANAVR